MSKEFPLSSNDRTFLRTSLSLGLRLDGRTLTDLRSLTIQFPSNSRSGCVEVRLGGTRVLATTTADLVRPFPDRPNEGSLNMFVNYSPMASSNFEPGFQSEYGIEIARIIDRGLRESRAIDTESLCVLAGEKVWSIRVDLHVVDHEGNLLDAINLAAVIALLHFRRPDVTVVGETVTVHSVEDRQPIPLALHHIPIAMSFAFFDPLSESGATAASNGTPPYYVIDPSLKEEAVSDGKLTVILNVHGEVCGLQKSGGLGVETSIILQCTQIALAKTIELTSIIQQSLKEDAAKQNTGNAIRRTSQPVFHAPTKPIDAFGVNVTKPAGQHQVTGKPIEVNMAAKDSDEDDDDEDEEDGSGEDDEEDASMSDGDDSNAAADAEFAQVAKQLQAKTTTQQQRKK